MSESPAQSKKHGKPTGNHPGCFLPFDFFHKRFRTSFHLTVILDSAAIILIQTIFVNSFIPEMALQNIRLWKPVLRLLSNGLCPRLPGI